GLGLIKVVDEFRVVGSTRNLRWRDIGFGLWLSAAGELGGQTVAVDASGEPGNQILALRPGKHSVSSFQAIYRHYGNLECRGGPSPRSARTAKSCTARGTTSANGCRWRTAGRP